MPPAEPPLPSRGCPFAGPSRLGVEPKGPVCGGAGQCRGCPLSAGCPVVVGERYSVEGFLASGYYADVFRARDLIGGDEVALKVYVDDPPRRRAWQHEIAALTHLAHPRIPRLRSSFESEGWLTVAMDFVAGIGLREHVERHGPLDPGAVVRLALEVGEALERVAALGWTYRDLHPRNVHICSPVGAVLLDFDGARPPGWPAFPSGRIGYRAPELAMSGAVTPACDVYSLAGCLYFALTGSDPSTEPGPLSLEGCLPTGSPLRFMLEQCRAEAPGPRPSIREVMDALEPR